MAATDCLLNCLREVRLERFHQNFTERGLINCEQLSSLLVDDYSRFGVVSTDDRRRLFQLVLIIKSVQADGIYCQHGTANDTAQQPIRVQQPTKSNIPAPFPAHRKEVLPDVTRNGVIPARKMAAAGNAGAKKCPAAPHRQFIKPISSDCNYRVQYEQPNQQVKLQATQETKVVTNSLAATADDSSGTPKFNCRKTLNFSDSDLFSDGIDGSYFHQTAVSGTSANPLSQSNKSVALSSPAAKLRPPQFVATSCVSSPRAFVIPAESQPITRHRNSGNHISQTDSQSSGSDRQTSHGMPQNVHATKQSSFQNRQSRQHAYFPSTKIPPAEDLPTHIEQIYHSNGYNYGIPGSMVHLTDKVLKYTSLTTYIHCVSKKGTPMLSIVTLKRINGF